MKQYNRRRYQKLLQALETWFVAYTGFKRQDHKCVGCFQACVSGSDSGGAAPCFTALQQLHLSLSHT
jgi:hypothetical protein